MWTDIPRDECFPNGNVVMRLFFCSEVFFVKAAATKAFRSEPSEPESSRCCILVRSLRYRRRGPLTSGIDFKAREYDLEKHGREAVHWPEKATLAWSESESESESEQKGTGFAIGARRVGPLMHRAPRKKAFRCLQ